MGRPCTVRICPKARHIGDPRSPPSWHPEVAPVAPPRRGTTPETTTETPAPLSQRRPEPQRRRSNRNAPAPTAATPITPSGSHGPPVLGSSPANGPRGAGRSFSNASTFVAVNPGGSVNVGSGAGLRVERPPDALAEGVPDLRGSSITGRAEVEAAGEGDAGEGDADEADGEGAGDGDADVDAADEGASGVPDAEGDRGAEVERDEVSAPVEACGEDEVPVVPGDDSELGASDVGDGAGGE